MPYYRWHRRCPPAPVSSRGVRTAVLGALALALFLAPAAFAGRAAGGARYLGFEGPAATDAYGGLSELAAELRVSRDARSLASVELSVPCRAAGFEHYLQVRLRRRGGGAPLAVDSVAARGVTVPKGNGWNRRQAALGYPTSSSGS